MRVGMIGPGLDVPGGMTAVHRTWLEAQSLRGVRVDYFETMGTGDRWTKIRKMVECEARFARALASGYRPDVFHIHVSDSLSFYRKWFYLEQARRTGRPVVAHLHGAEFEVFHDSSRVHAAAVHTMFQRATTVLALTGIAADTVRRWTGGRAHVRVLYNPVVVSRFDAPPRPAEAPPVVLFMGEVGDRKGTFDLLATVPGILAREPRTRFIFGGNGEVDRLREEAARLGVQDAVDIRGWLSGEAKLAAFREADIFCLPSYYENFPVAILEAMAARLPTVSTRVAGIPESVDEGVTGFMIAPGDRAALADRLLRLIGDAGLRSRMGTAARLQAEEKFDNEVVVRQLREIWEEAVSRAAPQGLAAAPDPA